MFAKPFRKEATPMLILKKFLPPNPEEYTHTFFNKPICPTSPINPFPTGL